MNQLESYIHDMVKNYCNITYTENSIVLYFKDTINGHNNLPDYIVERLKSYYDIYCTDVLIVLTEKSDDIPDKVTYLAGFALENRYERVKKGYSIQTVVDKFNDEMILQGKGDSINEKWVDGLENATQEITTYEKFVLDNI